MVRWPETATIVTKLEPDLAYV